MSYVMWDALHKQTCDLLTDVVEKAIDADSAYNECRYCDTAWADEYDRHSADCLSRRAKALLEFLYSLRREQHA